MSYLPKIWNRLEANLLIVLQETIEQEVNRRIKAKAEQKSDELSIPVKASAEVKVMQTQPLTCEIYENEPDDITLTFETGLGTFNLFLSRNDFFNVRSVINAFSPSDVIG